MRLSSGRRRGLVFVEFAIVAFLLTLLIGAMLAFGLLLFGANVAQQAVDVGARELARIPLPFDAEFPELDAATGTSSTNPDPNATTANGGDNVFANPDVQSQIFDEKFLVVTIGGTGDEDLPSDYTVDDVDDLLGRMPLLNRLLYPLMILDSTNGVIRYPGALVENANYADADGQRPELTVLVPLVFDRDDDGVETDIRWRAVVEEIRDVNGAGPFSLAAAPTGIDPGFVAVRINYPSQSGSLVAYRQEPGNTLDGVVNIPVTADDDTGFDPPAPYTLVTAADTGVGPHAGRYGLGRAFAHAQTVRPSRRVLTMQAIYRREVFSE